MSNVNKWIESETYEKWEYANRSQLTHDYGNHKRDEVDASGTYENFCMEAWEEMKKWKAMTEDEQLKALSKHEKKVLARFECALCDRRLDQAGCGGIYGTCQESVRIEKRIKCLGEINH